MSEPRAYPLAEIALHVGGEIVGDDNPEILGIATLSHAGPKDLTFLTQSRYRSDLATTRAAAVILARRDEGATKLPRIVCPDPYLAYAKAVELFHPATMPVPGTHPSATVDPQASIGNGTEIGAFCSIGKGAMIGQNVILSPGCIIGENTRIGDSSVLHPHVTIYPDVRVGQRTIIHAGAVLGSDGFGMARDAEGWRKIPQIGGVQVGDDVEIGANTTIDRGALNDTVIEDGVKLDNLIQIGHNVHVGAHSAFAGCVGIAGSARIGRRCTIGGGSVVLGHLEITDDVHIGAATVVTKSIRKVGQYAGLYPIQEQAAWARNAAQLRNLQSLEQRVRLLEGLLADAKKSKL